MQNFEDLLSTLYHKHEQDKLKNTQALKSLKHDYEKGIQEILSQDGISFEMLTQQKKIILDSLSKHKTHTSWLSDALGEDYLASAVEKCCNDYYNQTFLQQLDTIYEEYKNKPIDDKNKIRIEDKIINTICQYLTCGDSSHINMEKRRKKFVLLTHPDKKILVNSPAIEWFEKTLGKDCIFKYLENSIDMLTNPNKYPFNSSHDEDEEVTLDDWINHAQTQVREAPTYTQRVFYSSFYALLISIKQHKLTKENAPNFLSQLFLNLTPIASGVYSISFFAKEIAIAYGLSFALSKLGDYMNNSEIPLIRFLGYGAKNTSQIIYDTTNVLLLGLAAGNLQLANYAYTGGGYLVNLLNKDTITNFSGPQEFVSNLMANSYFEGMKFNNLPIKLLASPLEQYIWQQENQFFSKHRPGNQKSAILKTLLTQIKSIDEDKTPLNDKLTAIESLLKPLFDKKEFQAPNSRSVLAIQNALKIITEFKSYYSNDKSIPVDLITLKLKEYVRLQPKNQYFFSMRTGKIKVDLIEETLDSIDLVMYNQVLNPKQKLIEIQKLIDKLATDPIITGSGDKAINAIKHAQVALTSISPKTNEKALVAYIP